MQSSNVLRHMCCSKKYANVVDDPDGKIGGAEIDCHDMWQEHIVE